VTMRKIDCVIERRLLVNYRIDPKYVAALLPGPFRPQLVAGYAVGGVCFIRMTKVRPAHLPRAVGMTSENVAHRFAVEWDDAKGSHAGVYVPRRETSSRIAATMGRHVFPGAYHRARFQVSESDDLIRIDVRSRDGKVALSVETTPAVALTSELFPALNEAIDFFRLGALGFSPSATQGCMDNVRLQSANWAAKPVEIARMQSSLFDDTTLFGRGRCTLDSALLMTNIAARWTADPRGAEPRAGTRPGDVPAASADMTFARASFASGGEDAELRIG
jgi:uncharacterized protein YqjF (DUF2071 family)